MGSAVLANGLQTMIRQDIPASNYDHLTYGYVRMGTPTPGFIQMETYFTRPFPLKSTIVSATLYLYSGAGTQSGTITVQARRIKTAFSFTKVNWNTRPTTYYTGTASASKTGPVTAGTEFAIDVTAMMQSVSLGEAWYGFDIFSTNANPALIFYGPTHSVTQYRPRLEVEWADEPDQPRTLAPSGGRAVGVAKPILRCDYVDVSGDTTMAGMQVQINSTSTFTSPAFDSGTVITETPELDLNTTAYAGLTDGQVVYWRVRVQDGAGLWSEWSDPVDFKRDIKGTLTVNNPPSGTPIVEESTPPITWSFSGETQAAYQVTITSTSTLGQVKQWTTGKKTGTAATITVPAGVIASPDSTYSVSVRIWDNKQRETIANDPAYVEVVRAFTYVPSATVTATASPTAVGQSPYPRVLVGWTRATDPDSFTIMRNRRVIASNLLPNDVRVSGTTFSYLDKSPNPFSTLLYEVQAVVNGKASASNPTVSTTLQHVGIWLSNTDHTISCLITGREERAVTYGEDSEVVNVVGGTESVVVTQALRGMEGTITGELHSGIAGLATTAQEWRDNLLRIKAQAGRRCWLTFGDRTIQCVIRNVVIQPRPSTPVSFKVSFEFYQTGTLEFAPSL